MGRTRRRLLVLAGVVIVAAGGAATWWLLRPAEAASQPVVAEATVGTQRQTVAASGTVEPAEQADLSFTVSGEVTAVLVKEGDQVTVGQTLATVDDTLLQAQLTAAQAALDAAEDKASSADDASADASVVSAESDLAAAQDAVDNAALKSTINGTVVTVGLKVGDRVSTGASGSGSDTAQFTVASTKQFVVDAKVGSEDVAKVKQGMAVEVTVTGGSEPVDGTVSTVGLVAGADDSGVATFPVTVAVTGGRDDIYAGSSADVAIVVEERQNVLTVPAMALHTSGGRTYVNRMVDGKATRTDVRTGDSFGAQTEIVSGLKEGDEVEVAVVVPSGGGSGGNGQTGGVFPGGGGFGPGGGVRPGGGGFQGGGR
ncbi:biotin/lipoyl-binding protein [Actinophytocola oryzae]|uniref:Multidrug efflux pump subunit AcrA (Membrane-fusion protein) n=1 Tax=Actinophytocola oryzae TaxID=502181 RepID=A0A4R7UZC4_9PSEU|nr:biotin/lipoyl-binding protein [Actinophytocola oryzae]TDV41502.1 multidrug efflux pump subunit AcrA (membrane-fusion protein) [Actinophytocola oryzae]